MNCPLYAEPVKRIAGGDGMQQYPEAAVERAMKEWSRKLRGRSGQAGT